MVDRQWENIQRVKGGRHPGQPATNCAASLPHALREVLYDLAIVPRGELANVNEGGGVIEEVDRPIPV